MTKFLKETFIDPITKEVVKEINPKRYQFKGIRKDDGICAECGHYLKNQYIFQDLETGVEFSLGSECAYYFSLFFHNENKRLQKKITQLQYEIAQLIVYGKKDPKELEELFDCSFLVKEDKKEYTKIKVIITDISRDNKKLR